MQFIKRVKLSPSYDFLSKYAAKKIVKARHQRIQNLSQNKGQISATKNCLITCISKYNS